MTTGPITIVEYEPAHQHYFEQLYRGWFTKHFGLAPEAVDEFVLTQPEAAVLGKGGAILMILYKDELAGTVALKKEDGREGDDPGSDGQTYEFTKMAIGEEYRGKGLGEALSKAAIGKARSLGARRIVLYTHNSLKAAISLYRKLGFAETPLEPGHYSSFRCDIKMELWLDQVHS
ncbi:MAG TPA: GNAT family N-acetyltransferase [Puia sp.]|nr:GNAT family N-acetyltransferase [Puia sp.]